MILNTKSVWLRKNGLKFEAKISSIQILTLPCIKHGTLRKIPNFSETRFFLYEIEITMPIIIRCVMSLLQDVTLSSYFILITHLCKSLNRKKIKLAILLWIIDSVMNHSQMILNYKLQGKYILSHLESVLFSLEKLK